MAAVTRESNVYGLGDKFDLERTHVSAAQIRMWINRHRPIVVGGPGDEEFDLIYLGFCGKCLMCISYTWILL